VAPTNESICVVTLDAYKSVYGQEPVEVTNSSVDGLRSTFGWESVKNGMDENFPTDQSRIIYYEDTVPVYTEVHISPCYTW